MSVDRKSSNGKGTQRVESNGSGLSTTVQAISSGKASLKTLTGFGTSSADTSNITRYGESHRGETKRLEGEARQYSKTAPAQKLAPAPPKAPIKGKDAMVKAPALPTIKEPIKGKAPAPGKIESVGNERPRLPSNEPVRREQAPAPPQQRSSGDSPHDAFLRERAALYAKHGQSMPHENEPS